MSQYNQVLESIFYEGKYEYYIQIINGSHIGLYMFRFCNIGFYITMSGYNDCITNENVDYTNSTQFVLHTYIKPNARINLKQTDGGNLRYSSVIPFYISVFLDPKLQNRKILSKLARKKD
jgi:hypothetical protein